MALIDLRFNVRVQNIPRGEFLDEEGLYMRTRNNTPVKILTEKKRTN
jgi:hypothetical protein